MHATLNVKIALWIAWISTRDSTPKIFPRQTTNIYCYYVERNMLCNWEPWIRLVGKEDNINFSLPSWSPPLPSVLSLTEYSLWARHCASTFYVLSQLILMQLHEVGSIIPVLLRRSCDREKCSTLCHLPVCTRNLQVQFSFIFLTDFWICPCKGK